MAFLSRGVHRGISCCISLFQRKKTVSLRLCLRLLSLMASTLAVVPLGLLRMREFQNWAASQCIRSKSHLSCLTSINTLRHWSAPSFLRTRCPLGPFVSRKVLMTNTSLTGWGAVLEGRAVRWVWSPAHTFSQGRAHQFLELLTVFLSLTHVVQFLQNHHVLVRMDNTMGYSLYKLARRLTLSQTSHVSEEADNVGISCHCARRILQE